MATLLIYSSTFLGTSCLFYFSGRSSNRFKEFLLATAAIAPLCLLAAFRDVTVGDDVLYYGYWLFDRATYTPLIEYTQYYAGSQPLGFLLVAWFASHFTKSLPFYFLVLELLCVLPAYVTIRTVNRKTAWIGMLAYQLVLYCLSFNLMKQMIAVSISFACMPFIVKGKPLPCVVLVLIAALFQETAFIALLFYPLGRMILSHGTRRQFFFKWQIQILSVAIVLATVLGITFGGILLRMIAELKDSYSYQIAHAAQGNLYETMLVQLAAVLVALFLLRYGTTDGMNGFCLQANQKKPKSYYAMENMLVFLVVLGCLMGQASAVSPELRRLGYYGLIYICPFVSLASMHGPGNKGFIVAIGLLLVLFLCWILWLMVLGGGSDAYPYTSSILGILA